MNRHAIKRLRVVIVAALALIGSLHSSCNKYEILDGCTYPNDTTRAQKVWDRGHPNDWIDPNKDIKIHDYVTGNK